MMTALNLTAANIGTRTRAGTLKAGTAISGSGLKVHMKRIPAAATDEVTLDVLDLDGQSVLGDIASSSSPQLADTPNPGRVSGSGTIVSGLVEPLEVGALYVVSYDIIADSGTSALFFPAGGGSPFPNTAKAPFALGRHKVLVEAQDTDIKAILRVNGDLTFGFISCRKAEWRMTLPAGSSHPELAANREPGEFNGNGSVVSSLVEPLEVGEDYTLRYEISANTGAGGLYTPAGAGSPFPFRQLPFTPGHHSITLTAMDTDVEAIARATGQLTIRSFSCRKAGGGAGRQIRMNLAVGSARSSDTIYTPDPGAFYIAPWGDDSSGTGAFGSPFETPAAAVALAQPGDTIFLRPGVYPPFAIDKSGTPDHPITVRTLPGEERQAIVEGDLMQHKVHGGEGVEPDNTTRDGISLTACDYVHIRDLTVRHTWRFGIFVVGQDSEQHGHHVIAGNAVTMTGSSGIFVGGNNSSSLIPFDEKTNLRTTDILIEGNDVSHTNVVTDHNVDRTNSKGEAGGVAESISVASSSQNVITRFNDVHDTHQYGIDYKAGVRGGAIYGNRVWNIGRYGIYLDAGRRFVEDVAIYDNQVWACGIGIVLSREAGSNTVDYDTYKAQEGPHEFVQTLANIDIYNNLIWDSDAAGVFCQRHQQKDGPDGSLSNIRICFNTIYNANRAGTGRDLNLSGWSDPDFEAAGIASNVVFTGNIVWNDTQAVRIVDTFTGKPGFTVEVNLIGIDPSFADSGAMPPDLSLRPGSAAAAMIDPIAIEAPFDVDAAGTVRGPSGAAGAFAGPVD